MVEKKGKGGEGWGRGGGLLLTEILDSVRGQSAPDWIGPAGVFGGAGVEDGVQESGFAGALGGGGPCCDEEEGGKEHLFGGIDHTKERKEL